VLVQPRTGAVRRPVEKRRRLDGDAAGSMPINDLLQHFAAIDWHG
jgi:hypothetical protein